MSEQQESAVLDGLVDQAAKAIHESQPGHRLWDGLPAVPHAIAVEQARAALSVVVPLLVAKDAELAAVRAELAAAQAKADLAVEMHDAKARAFGKVYDAAGVPRGATFDELLAELAALRTELEGEQFWRDRHADAEKRCNAAERERDQAQQDGEVYRRDLLALAGRAGSLPDDAARQRIEELEAEVESLKLEVDAAEEHSRDLESGMDRQDYCPLADWVPALKSELNAAVRSWADRGGATPADPLVAGFLAARLHYGWTGEDGIAHGAECDTATSQGRYRCTCDPEDAANDAEAHAAEYVGGATPSADERERIAARSARGNGSLCDRLVRNRNPNGILRAPWRCRLERDHFGDCGRPVDDSPPLIGTGASDSYRSGPAPAGASPVTPEEPKR